MSNVKKTAKRATRTVAQPAGVATSNSAEATQAVMVITNNQRRSWIVPKNMMGSALFTTNNIVHPGCSIEVSKDEFEKYRKYKEGLGEGQKGSKAFSSMLDNKLLIASSKKTKLDMRDLKDDQPVAPPPHLVGDGAVKTQVIQKTPVTITLEKSSAESV